MLILSCWNFNLVWKHSFKNYCLFWFCYFNVFLNNLNTLLIPTAICSIGKTTVDVIKSILWSSQFDENAAVRLEAIHTLLLLKCNSDEVIRVLKNRLIVEENRMVKESVFELILNSIVSFYFYFMLVFKYLYFLPEVFK